MEKKTLSHLLYSFSNLGEVRMLAEIVSRMNDEFIYYQNAIAADEIKDDSGLAYSTQAGYLSKMVRSGVLERMARGMYRVRGEYRSLFKQLYKHKLLS